MFPLPSSNYALNATKRTCENFARARRTNPPEPDAHRNMHGVKCPIQWDSATSLKAGTTLS